jgi:hypothetical protein
MEPVHRTKQLPGTGQRCLVWRDLYKRWEFAYFDYNDHSFYQMKDGLGFLIDDVDWWMPEPAEIGTHWKD